MDDRKALRFALVLVAVIGAFQFYASFLQAASPEGFPRMGFPREPIARTAALERVDEVYRAIDAATDDPALRDELRRRCRTESWCNWYGVTDVHAGDASLGRKRWRKAVARGLLDPEACEVHELGETREEWVWWSTVGAFGTVSSYVIRHRGECADPHDMVDPFVAADLAVAHAGVLCRRYKACTCPKRARWWAGPGLWDRRSPLDRMTRTVRQCGEQPESDVAVAYVMTPWWYFNEGLKGCTRLVAMIREIALA